MNCINLFLTYHQFSTYHYHRFKCFVRISEQTATFALYSINWLVLITVVESVYCTVRTDSLYKADYVSSLKGCLCCWVNPWSWTLLGNLTLTELIKKLCVFYGRWRFVALCKTSRHLPWIWARWIQSTLQKINNQRLHISLPYAKQSNKKPTNQTQSDPNNTKNKTKFK